jgi:hypothetical protein
MKKVVMAAAAMFLFSFAASAWPNDYDKYETFLGYTYTWFATGNFVPAPFDVNVPSFSANGGSAQFAYNFNRWFGLVLDGGAVYGSGAGVFGNPAIFPSTFSRGGFNGTLANYLLGPRVSFKRGSRFVPYIQTLFGGATAWESLPVPDIAFVTPINVSGGVLIPNGAQLRYTRVTSGFAMTAGGGIDIKLNKHVYLRPIQAEYFLTRLSPIGAFGVTNRSNFRYSAGINFSYGGAPK